MIKIIFFDFGNVLVTYDKVFTKVCNDFEINLDEFWKFYNKFDDALAFGEIETRYFWKKCIENFNLDLDKTKNYDFAKAWVSDYKIIKPVNDFIYEIKNKINIGIISNINSEIWETALRENFVPKINYKCVILSYKEKTNKPKKEIYEMAQKKSGANSGEILFIDDKQENLVEPRKMGWKTILFDPSKAEEGVEEIRKAIEN